MHLDWWTPRLVLNNNSFSDSIPSEVGMLESVVRLDFANNDFIGAMPKELSHLAQYGSLEYLSLRGNALLTGEVDNDLCLLNTMAFDCSSVLCGCNCTC